MNRFFALMLVAAGGATLFGCKNTVSINTGGSTASSTHATVTVATGTSVTGTGNTTGALVGSTTASGGMTQCQSLCDFDNQLSTQLGCAPQPATCASSCESLYAMAPQCGSKLDELISCGEQQANASTCKCDTMNGNSLNCPNICTPQQQALSTCIKGSSTSSGMTAVASSSAGGGG